MFACPSQNHRNDLDRLLSGELPEAEQARLTAHLDMCVDCRKALDALAARSGLWDDLSLLKSDELHEPTEDLTAVTARDSTDDEELPLGLLESVDEPGLLGKLGSYDVLRVIGRGGMGVVFLGRDRALDRLVAIKVLTPGMSATPAARRRFAREAKAAAAVVHEHVVAIHAVDSLPQGVPYLVMQYIAGKSLQDVIDRGKTPELAEILRIGSQAASALAAAHAQGLIHRDVKPANILLENGVERVKITDFGLARAVDDATMTQSGVVAGTPQYMSPEQAGGDAIDHRTDLFSLGSVLYTLCTGQAPFRGLSSMATLRKVCEQTPRPIQELNPEIPSWLVRIIDRLHAKNPADRYGSAAEVADLLGRCLAHVQQPTSVPLPAELLPARKRRTMAIWGAIPVGLMLVGLLSFPGAREAAGQAVGYVATVLRFRTSEGTLVVETDDPDVGIKLDGSELVVTGAGVKELRLSVGKHSIQALKDGKILRDELVTIRRGGRTVLTVRREREAEPPPPTPVEHSTPRLEFDQDPSGLFRRREESITKTKANPMLQGNLLKFITPGSSASEVRHLADVLKKNPPRPDSDPREGMRLFMRDLAEGRAVPIIDPTMFGMRFAETPTWSHDGRRILFHVQPRKSDGREARLVMVEDRDGRPDFRDLGEGACPGFSPDDRTIAFLLFPGEGSEANGGVWLMNVDGTNRRRVGDYGNPYWSPDGFDLLINSWGEPTESKLYNFSTKRTVEIKVPGRRIYSAPRWIGPGLLVACVGDERKPDSIVLLDVSRSSVATVVRTLWKRASGPDAFPRWPVISPSTGDCYFVGDEGNTRTLYSLSTGSDGPGRVAALDVGGHKLSGLSFSPDGRYLLFASDRLDPEPSGRASAWIGNNQAQEVDRLAEVLRRNPPRRGAKTGERMQLYVKDLTDGGTTLIVDEPVPGLNWTGAPDWSHDGTRIVFDASPGKDWVKSRLMILENREGKPSFRDLGAGNCARFSPDDQRVAFLLNPGAAPGEEAGAYIMQADGTGRSRIGGFGAPFWSEDGRQILINSFSDPTDCELYSTSTRETTRISVLGHKIFSWPRWAGPEMLVACVGTGNEPDAIVLLDISRPSQSRIVETIWQRPSQQDVYARWPLYSPRTGTCYFVGVEGQKRTLLAVKRGGAGRARPVEGQGLEDELGGLTLSPNGRYLLFGANRPDRAN
ncbi:MAG: protein kinase [Paludisphaera borealis]|uniref:protein kinase domain-containing protein n=1 Tax=Paludisphaera borealis TaxID=1387353 RepID=UPI00284BA1E1|nr:protein kinase [Paludisphaera borealis]MDR3618727.1 protein kinase [Paludisphaera borealis]